MANEERGSNDFQTVIRILQEKRALIDAAIQSVVAASGAFFPSGEGSAVFAGPNGGDSQPTELPRGAFLNKSLPAAVKLYLSAVVKKKTIKEIANALREGGVESTSDNFEGVITGCLHRMKSNGELLQFKDGWALAENYPAHIRASLSHGGGTHRKAPKKKSARKKVPQIAKQVQLLPGATAAARQLVMGLEERIEQFAKDQILHSFSAADVIEALPGVERKSLPLVLGRLAKKHRWIKESDGKYRVPE